MKESKNALEAASSSLMLYDPEKNDLYFEVALGKKGERIKDVIRLEMGQGIAGDCATKRKTFIVNDVASDKRHFRRADQVSKFKTRNLIATPMVRGNDLIGVLEVLNKKDGDFTEEDSRVLRIIADSAAIAIENAHLIEANVRAERLAAMGQAVASISHYVKNILAGMKGGSSLVNLGIEKDDMDMIQSAWGILLRSTNKINNLVQDMLTYSKERKLDLQVEDINKHVQEIVDLCAPTAKDKKVDLEINLSDEPVHCLLEPDVFQDAVLNLIGNAIEAVKGVEDSRVKIETYVTKKENKAHIFIEDNGCGIPEEIISKIFDPFFSTKGSKGTGLGLAVTKKVIEEHGGRIEVISKPGEGTSFHIILPLAKDF